MNCWWKLGASSSVAFVDRQLWDEMIVYVAPKLMGSDARPLADVKIAEMASAIGATIVSSTQIGSDLRVIVRRDESTKQAA